MRFIILILVLFLFQCEYGKILEVYKQNKLGIEKQSDKKFEDSIPFFYESKSYNFRSYIPNYNLGNTYLLQNKFADAHKKYEESLDEKPDFVESIYNDGVLLYTWGEFELDPKICNTKKAKELWEQSKTRFEESISKDKSSIYKKQSIENKEFIASKLEELLKKDKSICENLHTEQKDANTNESNDKNKNDSNQKNSNANQSPSLSSEEQEQIEKELQRIKGKEMSSKSYRRSRHQQNSKKYKTEELKKVLEETVW